MTADGDPTRPALGQGTRATKRRKMNQQLAKARMKEMLAQSKADVANMPREGDADGSASASQSRAQGNRPAQSTAFVDAGEAQAQAIDSRPGVVEEDSADEDDGGIALL